MNLKLLTTLIKSNIIATLGVVGLISAIIYTFIMGNPPPATPNQLTLPPTAPFPHNISASGLIEANTQNINVGSFTSGVVDKVFVVEGNIVKQGDPLFSLDQRTATTQLALNEKQLETAHHNIEVTKADLAEAHDQYKRSQHLKAGVLSAEDVKKREFAVQKMEAQLRLNQSKLEEARHQVALSKITLDKLTVTAPVDGLILKVRIRPGEYIGDVSQNIVPVTMGNDQPLYIRAQIDENDGWRFKPNLKAIAYLRSNKDINFPLSFVRIEPYAQPKQQLSGDSRELVDTRVIEVIYKVEANPQNIFIGQQVDVFIEAEIG
jgi:RND family efflux transporter MFP subunit